jgi:uncharacterized protein YybS (DUF2232 family)
MIDDPAEEQPSLPKPGVDLPPPDSGLDAGRVNSGQAEEEPTDAAAWQAADAALETVPAARSASASAGLGSVRVRNVDPASPIVMVETAFLASASSLVWLINFYFPFPLFRLFFPIPIAIAYLRWGHRAAWMTTLVSGLLLSVLMGPVRSLLFIMPFGFLGVLLGVLWRRGAPWGTAIAIGGLLGTIGFFFRIWLSSILLGEDLWAYSTAQVTDLLEWLFVRLGLLIQPNLGMIQAAILVMVLLNFWVYTFVVHLIAWITLDRLGNPIPRPPKWVQVLMNYE